MRAPPDERTGNGQATSARDLIATVIVDAQRLVALEIALAKQELKELAVSNAIAAGMMAFGGLVLLLGVLVAVPTIVVLLVPWHWQAAAVWAVAYVVVGIALILIGKTRLRFQLPTRTLGSLKENKEWAIRHVKSNSR